MNWVTTAGVGLDLAFGDPRWMPHPVRAIGWLIARQDEWLPRTKLGGVLLWFVTVGAAGAVVAGTLQLAPLLSIYWIYSLVAIRDLDRHAAAVIGALPDLPAARERLALIVGRDTAHLGESEIVRATVETVAENLTDGIVAPLFYLALGGPVWMAAYKAVNTLDSMVGYRDDRYRDFGWFSARADDWANWIPARLTAALIWVICLWPGFGLARSIRVSVRDGASQPSPNAGFPEAAVAGALGVQLGGTNTYRGVSNKKAHLGDPVRPLEASLFPRLRIILYGVALIATAGASLR